MQKQCAMLKFFCLLVSRSFWLLYSAISATSRLKCLSKQTVAFLPFSDHQITAAGPQTCHSARIPWLGNGGLALLAECLQSRTASGPNRHSE